MQTSSGAFERVVQGGKLNAMGGAVAASANDAWASFSNPGTLPTVTLSTLSLAYIPGQFGLSELARSGFCLAVPTSAGVFALGGSRFGCALYNEFTASLAYGVRLNSVLAAGLCVNAYRLSIARYGNAWSVGADIGALLTISRSLQWGIAACNINGPTIGKTDEDLPQMILTGLRYVPFDGTSVRVDLQKDILYPVELHLGIEVSFLGMVAVRGGTTSELSTFGFGVGVRYEVIQLDYALTTHFDLGTTHHVSISLFFGTWD
jgi:hypothetical protein